MLDQHIRTLIEPVIQSHGFEIWSCEVHHSGRHSLLRVTIDNVETGVSLESCALISREIGAILDVEDPIKTEYQLEISSPGMDRVLSTIPHFTRYIGADIKVKFRAPHAHKSGIATIEKVEGDTLYLIANKETMQVTLGDIQKANVLVR
jgi:ribosome maturation factor RimP